MDSKRCSNCELEVSLSNYVIHEAFCLRNLKKCEQCETMVLKNSWNDHISSEHSTVQCSLCKTNVEKFLLSDHELLCPARLVKCDYCNYELPARSADDHRTRCGSRTELCSVCNKYVMIRDFQLHSNIHNLVSRSPRDKTVMSDDEDFNLALRLQCVELNCPLENVDGSSALVNSTDTVCPTALNDSTLVPCEICHGLYKLTHIVDHQVACYAESFGTPSPPCLQLPPLDRLSTMRKPSSPLPSTQLEQVESKDIGSAETRTHVDMQNSVDIRVNQKVSFPKSTTDDGTTPSKRGIPAESQPCRPTYQRPKQYSLPPLRDPLIRSRAAVTRGLLPASRTSATQYSNRSRRAPVAHARPGLPGEPLLSNPIPSPTRSTSQQKSKRPITNHSGRLL